MLAEKERFFFMRKTCAISNSSSRKVAASWSSAAARVTLAALQPSFGVGVDFSKGMIAEARKAHPHLTFMLGDIEDESFVRSRPFDVVLIVDTCQHAFELLHPLFTRETRLIIAYFSHLWHPEAGRSHSRANAAASTKRAGTG